MSRINTNIPSVIAQANLSRNNKELSIRLERLSTGLRINRGADDPAGLIISERMRSDIAGVDQGIKNSDRASSMISTTEAALAEVNDLLNSIRGLIVESANTGAVSEEERNANQLQIDSAIESITRISNTATFGGLRLLDGSLDYSLSGVRTSAIAVAQVRSASLINNASLKVDVDVLTSAQRGKLFFRSSAATPGVFLSTMNLEIKGPKGVQELRFLSNTALSNVVAGVNNLKNFTGVEAVLLPGNSGMVFRSLEYGGDEFVSVRRTNAPTAGNTFQLFRYPQATAEPAAATWASMESATDDRGRDVTAIVNGYLATGRGLSMSVNSPALSLDLKLTESLATLPSAAVSSFYITGGGALFQLGPEVTALQQTNFGIPSVAASRLGAAKTDNGIEFLSSLKTGARNSIAEAVRRNDFTAAQDVLGAAIDEVTELRGRLGAFEKNVLDTNVRSLQSQFENLTASESRIRDADFAFETSRLTRAQILASAGTSTLSLANQQSQSVLQLLNG
ncbi:MAG TPA: flagellin [Phycisphaerales bacterium]|nr:flagellin [Phycisphaerales bacterium]